MRDDEKKRLHSGRNSTTAWPTQAPSYSSAPYRAAPTTTAVLTTPTAVQSYDFAPRGSAAQSPTHIAPAPQYSSQAPLVTPTRVEEFGPSSQYRPLQPDVIYTQVTVTSCDDSTEMQLHAIDQMLGEFYYDEHLADRAV
ncbi:hypothetical protein NECAME_00917 [Necator americanus]|uniref:Uncharacterized protein n=1 Tax=Necator americanus TaxID=51031 RepID=W2SNX6_NECAM|nr:hypothetical protein NECAME_00917 [Necator americanus]ETN71228.1 hypothetical protein NECAME_00917 [Necator americanus]